MGTHQNQNISNLKDVWIKQKVKKKNKKKKIVNRLFGINDLNENPNNHFRSLNMRKTTCKK